MISAVCKVCDLPRVKKIALQANLAYFCCSNCLYCEKQPESGSVHADFVTSQQAYYEDPLVDPFSEPESVIAEKIKSRIAVTKKYIASGSSILEVGPGSGKFLNWAIEAGYDCTACEQSSILTTSLRARGFNVLKGEFEQVSLEGVFDAICSFHIIEHVESPAMHFEKALRLTRPGGYMIVATPNAGSWEQRLFPVLSANFDSAHLHVLSKKSLAILSSKAGWDIVDLATPEISSGWLRIVSKIIRRVRKEDESLTAGKYSDLSASSGRASSILRAWSIASAPLRAVQSLSGGGNEIMMVLRKPNTESAA